MSAWRHPRLSCGAFPRENDSPAPRLRALTAFPRRERVVYPDGNRDAVAALSALLAPDVQLTAPDVQVLPADASPALEAALWAVCTPRGNRDLQRALDNLRQSESHSTRRSSTRRPPPSSLSATRPAPTSTRPASGSDRAATSASSSARAPGTRGTARGPRYRGDYPSSP